MVDEKIHFSGSPWSQHASAFPVSGHFLPVFSGRTNFHAATYYYLSNSVVPSKKIIYGVGRDELFEALIREYKIDLSTVIRHDSYGSDFTYIIQAYIPIKEIWLCIFVQKRGCRNFISSGCKRESSPGLDGFPHSI
ncbi:MAG: hypothetical protein IPP86_17935 [Bacteroidetes bacterium]|nr:hypothetical protein [Bacteroidota bacterium]